MSPVMYSGIVCNVLSKFDNGDLLVEHPDQGEVRIAYLNDAEVYVRSSTLAESLTVEAIPLLSVFQNLKSWFRTHPGDMQVLWYNQFKSRYPEIPDVILVDLKNAAIMSLEAQNVQS